MSPRYDWEHLDLLAVLQDERLAFLFREVPPLSHSLLLLFFIGL